MFPTIYAISGPICPLNLVSLTEVLVMRERQPFLKFIAALKASFTWTNTIQIFWIDNGVNEVSEVSQKFSIADTNPYIWL